MSTNPDSYSRAASVNYLQIDDFSVKPQRFIQVPYSQSAPAERSLWRADRLYLQP